MFEWLYTLLMCLSVWFISLIGTYALKESAALLNPPSEPNERDNHTRPTPKGGGLPVMLGIVGMLVVTGAEGSVIAALLLLMVVSFMNDMKEMSPIFRLSAHVLAASLIVSTADARLLAGIVPGYVEYALLSLLLVWFMNLYNFMDGIDEITSVQSVMTCAALASITFIHETVPNVIGYDALIIIAAVAGFWHFNRHPAQIFMGDVGSVPLGAVIGWLLLTIAAEGYAEVALILPAYYVTDATVTLLARLLKGYDILQPHSEHGYQRYVRSGKSHTQAVKWIAVINIACAVLALAASATEYSLLGWVCALAAYSLSLLLYLYFITRRPKPVRETPTKVEIIPPSEDQKEVEVSHAPA